MNKKGTKKRRAVILIILLCIILGIILAVVNFIGIANIKAFYRGITSHPEDVDHLIIENDKTTVDALTNNGMNLSQDDLGKLNDGSLTEEEKAAIILNSMNSGNASSGDGVPPQSGETENPDEQTPPEDPVQTPNNAEETTPTVPDSGKTEEDVSTPANPPQAGTPSAGETPGQSNPTTSTPATSTGKLTEEEYNKSVADLVAKVYVIKANFLATLSSFENTIISQYKALPPEQHTTATKAKIVADNMAYVTGLEAQCDAQVKEVTDALTKLMKENGKDNSLVDAINKAYANEKELKKAYYISLYK